MALVQTVVHTEVIFVGRAGVGGKQAGLPPTPGHPPPQAPPTCPKGYGDQTSAPHQPTSADWEALRQHNSISLRLCSSAGGAVAPPPRGYSVISGSLVGVIMGGMLCVLQARVGREQRCC